MNFASANPHYLTKVEKKGGTQAELHQVIEWLTGYDENKLKSLLEEKVTFETFFKNVALNPDAHLITGLVCGYRVEEIENPLTEKERFLEKLVDELVKVRRMEYNIRYAIYEVICFL